jgi:hypothetical protein
MDRPHARTQGLIVEQVDDGLVVFDEHAQVAHSFSAAVTAVWTVSDGTRTVSEIAAQSGLEAPVVQQAIDELSERGLLEGRVASSAPISRREGMRRLVQAGGAAFAAPLIYSVAISPAMAAASSSCTVPNGSTVSECYTGFSTICSYTEGVSGPPHTTGPCCASGTCYVSCVDGSETNTATFYCDDPATCAAYGEACTENENFTSNCCNSSLGICQGGFCTE